MSQTTKLMKCKEHASRIYDNFELKWWLRRAGSKRRCISCMLLTKLKDDLKKLSLSKRAVHLGLMQLARKPHVILDRRLADCYRRKIELSPQDKIPLQLSQNSPQNFVLVQKERWQNDDEKKSRSEPRSLEYISQKTDEQIADDSVNASSSVTTASSEIRTYANKTYQIKIQERSLPGKKSSDNIVQNPVQEMEEKSSHVNGSTLTNDRNISAKEKLDSPMSKNKSRSKSQICGQKSENKNFYSKNETISAKNRSVNKKHSSENKLFKTNISIRLKKHYSISDIDVSKNDKIFEKKRKQDEKKQKEETEVNQEFSSPKINLLNLGIENRDYESESNDISCERNINVSGDTIISNVRTCLGTETNDITSENQDTSISNTQTSRVDSELLSEQTHTPSSKMFVKTDIDRDENIRTKQMDSPRIEIDSKIAVKRKIYSKSSNKSVLMKKVKKVKRQKKKETSSDSSLDENLSNLEVFDDKDFSEDKLIHNNESEEQMYRKITKYTKRKSKYSRKKTKLKRKRQNKIKRIRRKFRDWFGNCFSQSESSEELNIILECLERKKLQFFSDDSEMDNTFNDITTEEDTYERDKISIHSCDTSITNSQKDTESVISKSESINSSDSTVSIENDTLHDFTMDEEINETTDFNSDKISIRKRDISVDISQKNIENTIPAKIQRLEHSVSIADAEIISKNDTKCSEDTVHMETEEINMQDVRQNQENIENIIFEDVEMKEVNMQDAQEIKNVDLAKEDMKISKDIESNLELSSISTQKLTSNIEDKNDYDVSQNIEDVLLKNNEDISENTTTVITDHVSIVSTKSEEDSSDKKDVVNETFFAPIANVSVKKSENTSDHSSTDDDISDIEVEIKIKPKSKSRVSQKFSLKAPLSAVNTYIKNLNTFKNNPDFLDDLFQMNFNTSSENSRHENTISEENEAKNTSKKSQDVNQNVTTQIASNTREIIFNSSHTTKDNANHCSKQQQERSSQDDTIFDRNKNATQHNQEETNKQIQSEQEKTRVIGENGSELIKSACDASDLEKQLSKTFSSDKGKTIDEQQQNFQDDITLKDKDATNQAEKNECVQSVARKETRVAAENSVESAKPTRDETRVAAENSVESAKPVRDMPEMKEQLPKTSSDTSDVRRISGVRVRTNMELGSSWVTPMNLSMNSNISIAPNSTHSVFPVSSASGPPPSYNSSIKSMYHSPVANFSSVPTENVPPSFNNNMKLIQTAVRSICLSFISCRNIIREQIFNEKKVCEMKINITRICQDIKTLKMLLRVTNEDYIINYINRQNLIIPLISAAEFQQYTKLFEPVSKCNVPFCDKCFNRIPQPSNISNSSVPNASMTNVHAQTPFLGNVPNVPLPGSIPRMPHVRAQSSTIPRPRSNINRSQSWRSTSNPLYSRQSMPNIRPQSSHVGVPLSNPVPNSIPNPAIKSQQPTGNASYVQSQYVPTNMVNINNQQFVVNLNSSPYTVPSLVSTSNINVRVYPSVNQGNTDISSTTGIMHSHIGTRTTTTATINSMPTINTQQQNQIIYSQMPSYVRPQLPLPIMNQNTNKTYQIIYNAQPQTYTNINVPSNTANITENITTVGFGDRFVNPQTTTSVSYEKSIPSSNNVSNSFTSQPVHVQNISLNPNQQQQNVLHQEQSKNTSIILNLINMLDNNVPQNVQPSVQNNRTKIPETQTIDPVPNKTSFTKPQQDVYQRIPSQESRTSSKIPMSQEPSILQNTMFNTASQKSQTILMSPKTTSVPSSSNEIERYCFDLSFLTELDKYRLLLYLQFYFKRCSFPEQNSEKFQRDRKMLISLYKYLSRIMSYITKLEDKKSPMDIAQKVAVLRNFPLEIKLLHNETQCNKNNPICDKVQEKQSSEKTTDSNAPINSKSTAAKNDLSMEVQNRELDPKSIPKFPINKELLGKSPEIDLQKQNIDTPKMRFKRILSSAMRKESENVTSLTRQHSNIPRENPIPETSRRISETEAQNDAKINTIIKSLTENSHDKQLSESCFSLAQDTPSPLRIALNDEIKGCEKITKDDAKKIDNTEVERISKISNVTLNNRGNDVILQSSFNSETHNNITDKEAVKSPAEHLHDKRSCSSFAQSTLNLQYDKTKNDNINVKRSENAEMANICKISKVAVLNNSEGNEKAASQIPCNIEARDKELYHNEACNPSNKICGQNSQDKLRDNVKENIEKSKSDFTEAQFDTSRISRTSTPLAPNNTSELLLPTNKNESAQKLQAHTACKKFTFETFSEFFLNAQEDPTNELINDSEKTCDESSESSGNLQIDENAEKSNSDSQEEQCDAILSSEKNKLNTSQDLCLNKTKGEPIETSLSSFAKGFELKSLEKKETNVQELNEKSKQKELQTEGTSSSKVLEDTSRASNTAQSIDIVKQFEDIRENQVQIDTHSGVKAINELLKHVSDKYYGKPRTSSCNLKSNAINININETPKSVISNVIANVASPAKNENDDENSDIGLNILNITSISSSLFEEMENSDLFQNSFALLNEMEDKELSYVNMRNHSEVANSVSSNEMKQEESSNVNENPEVPNSVSLNETKKEMSDVNDNPKVFDSTLLNKIKMKELDMNNTKVPNSAISEMEEEMLLDENLEALCSASLNEIKIEELDIIDNPELPDSASLTEMKEEKSSVVNDNPEVSDSTLLNKIKIEESLDMNNPKVPNSAMSEMEEEMSLVVDENLEALCSASLNEIKIEELDIIDNPELPDSASLNEMKEKKSSVVNDNPEVSDSTLLNKIKIEESLDMNNPNVPNNAISAMNETKEEMPLVVDENLEEILCCALNALNEIKIEELDIIDDNPELPDSTSLNEIKEEKSSVVNDNLGVNNFVWLPEMIEEKSLNVNDNPEIFNSTSLNEIEEKKSLDVNNIPEVSNFASLNEVEQRKSLDVDNIPEVSNCTSLNEVKEKKSSDNIPEDGLDEMENRPCLRCKRKSTVCCQACLEAHYCSKRCSDLHWRAIHYKQCKNLYKSIICIDL